MDEAAPGSAVRRWIALAAALVLLNGSLTFVSVWPTLAVRPSARLSPDAALLVLGLAVAAAIGWAPVSRRVQRLLAGLWVVLVAAHYVEVTTRSLYGREFNLYWDLQLLPDVGAMFAAVARPAVLLALAAALLVIPLLVFLPMRWAIGVVSQACARPAVRWTLAGAAMATLAVGGLQPFTGDRLATLPVAPPVSMAIAGEAAELAREVRGGGRIVPAAPSIDSDLAYVRGADVVVLFVESYGLTSWERPEFRDALAPRRADLLAAIADTGRSVVTTAVESTTFGGESWLAHISLLSGTEVRDADLNRRLMAERRDTLVTAFARRGYRTLAVMPGLHSPWPEGEAFYGFDRLYGAPDLGYAGPPFGWWDVTDQFVVARMDALAFPPDAASPAFVFMPTISTHAPFTPVPPYQPDWTRLLTATPYEADDLTKAYDEWPDWSNLGPGYARALAYLHQTLAGYLRQRADRDLVLIVVGDHQPPALVTGEGASWNVPVHVVTSRPEVLERLRARGFTDGLEPPAQALARMDTLMPLLLGAFGNAGEPPAADEPISSSAAAGR